MPRNSRFGRGDALAIVTLLATAVVIAWPILRGGYLTYIDNAVHLAEVRDLARVGGNGWSEIGFAGFPLATLHSPLWYPCLAWLVRHGAPLHPLYAGLLLAGFVAPSLALYRVARAHLSAFRAGALAYVLLIQAPMIWGIGSPLAGMWTNALASAILVLLVDLYARPALAAKEHWGAAALLGLAVLTHLFVLPLVLLIALITTALHLKDGTMTWRELGARAAGGVIAAAASAHYWLTFVWVGNLGAAPLQALPPAHLAARLLLPADPMFLVNDRLKDSIRLDSFLTDSAPLLLVVGLGIYGFFQRRRPRDALGRTGFYLALTVLGCLLVHRYYPLRFLGPVSWRLIDWIRIGLCLSAIAPLAPAGQPSVAQVTARPTPGAWLAAVAAVCLGSWWGLPLRHDTARDLRPDLARIETLWAWLRQNARPEWGRIYLQDTFGWGWGQGGLAQSHVLALTSENTGLRQLGTYYGIVPYGLRWTLSEFKALFAAREPTEPWLLEAMEKTNAGVLVTSDPDMGAIVEPMPGFERLFRTGDFEVFRRKGAVDDPIAELTEANHVSHVRFETGEIRFDLTTDYSRTRVLVKTGFHPWWRLEGIPGAWLRESPEGFLVIDDVPDGTFAVHLAYAPSPLPARISILGWAALAAWGAALTWGSKRLRGASVS